MKIEVTQKEKNDGVEFVAERLEEVLRHYIEQSADGTVMVSLHPEEGGFLFAFSEKEA